ncbi:hypothetical protein AAT19DRAFT_16220 [Rhodotorula toruloides]|uniref:Uncharacterized protein n=1 Tax=Rhodotorula toruloides TaxID=5286 RepID=A0A2T0A620_RHOTO|nr:hypothetical protein AAT19DRAFT_16220 [Rhodotorula toruloides]
MYCCLSAILLTRLTLACQPDCGFGRPYSSDRLLCPCVRDSYADAANFSDLSAESGQATGAGYIMSGSCNETEQ